MWGHMGDYSWGGMGMGIGMVLWWGVLAIALILLVRYVTRPGKEEEKPKDAHEILAERYARGEIGREEYEQKKHDLEI